MDEYIKREAAIKAIEKADYTLIANDADDCKADYLREIIESVPSADVAPVVYGHWIWHEEEFEYECSVCHCRFDYNHTFEIFDHGFQYANYCPNCGAKMNESKCEGVQHNG